MKSGNQDFHPHIGNLLWAAQQRARTEGIAGYVADKARVGADLPPAHARILELVPDEGVRLTDLAARVRITKQALGQLAALLAEHGYVQLTPDPSDGRAKLIRPTARGRRAQKTIRDAVASVEDRWRDQIGAKRYDTFRAVLAELGEGHGVTADG